MGPALPLNESRVLPYFLLAVAPYITGIWSLRRNPPQAGALERLIAAGSVWLFAPLFDLYMVLFFYTQDSYVPRIFVITIDAVRAIPQAALITVALVAYVKLLMHTLNAWKFALKCVITTGLYVAGLDLMVWLWRVVNDPALRGRLP